MKKLTLVFAVITLILYGCNKNSQEPLPGDESSFSLTKEQTSFLNEMYYQFNQSPATHLPTVRDQASRIASYIAANGQSVDLKEYHELFTNENKADPIYVDYLENMVSIVETYGFDQRSIEALEAFKKDVLSAGGVSKDEKLFLDANVEILSFMINSQEAQTYLLKLNTSKTSSTQARSPLKCAIYIVVFGVHFVECMSGHVLSCLLLPLEVAHVAESCGSDDEPVDPCENNPDPCCGVHCIPGYMCVNGDCIPDPNFDGCPNVPCPPGYICATNECIPL